MTDPTVAHPPAAPATVGAALAAAAAAGDGVSAGAPVSAGRDSAAAPAAWESVSAAAPAAGESVSTAAPAAGGSVSATVPAAGESDVPVVVPAAGQSVSAAMPAAGEAGRVLRFRLSRADADAYAALGAAFSGRRRILLWLGVAVAGLASGWVLEEAGRSIDTPAGIALAVAVTAGAFGLVGLAVRLDRRRRAGAVALPAGTTTVTVAADGAVRRIAIGDIAHVAATADHLFLFTAPDAAVIVPGTAIGDAAAIRALADAIDRAADAATP